MKTLALGLLAFSAALASSSHAASAIALNPGTPINFTIPAGSVTNSYYVEVPAGTDSGELAVALDSTDGADVDMLLRYGTPFANGLLPGGRIDYLTLFRYAQYLSASAGGNESIRITPASHQPLRSGRWYVSVINGSPRASSVNLGASLTTIAHNAGIVVDFASTDSDCDVSPWNDATAATPRGGNMGTTIGQQRRNALSHATDLLSQRIHSPVPITVQACWKHLGGTDTRAVLANASPTYITRGDLNFPSPWLPANYTWYAISANSRLGGARACALVGGACNEPDIVATFNADIGTAAVLGGMDFYLGLDPGEGPGDIADFVSVSMHELTHGLGFLGLVNTDSDSDHLGARFSGEGDSSYDPPGYDDAFSSQAAIVPVPVQVGLFMPFLSPLVSDDDRADAMVSGTGLRWMGANAVESPLNPHAGLAAPSSFPRLYAPCHKDQPVDPCTTESGSTLSHLDEAGELMNAFYSGTSRSLGLASPMLDAVGWNNSPSPIPQYTRPMPSNWYDPVHNGHGIDLRRLVADPDLGDIYYVVFYTYDAQGTPDIYTSVGRLVDGAFVSGPDAYGHSLQHIRYDAANHRSVLDPSTGGTLLIDFNNAAAAPACRSGGDRSGAAQLAVMSWSIDNESANWCMQPIVPTSQHPAPDFNGIWYAGEGDSGWGVSVLDVDQSPARSHLTTVVYYPDASGTLRWAIGESGSFTSGTPFQLLGLHGYCRLCTPVAPVSQPIGEITLTLNAATAEPPGQVPTGINRISIDVGYGSDTQRFQRTNLPFTMQSIPENGGD